MKALVYHGPGQKAWEEVAKPVIRDDTDAIVRVDATTICGTDLHILKGDVPRSPTAGSSATKRSAPSRRSAPAVKNGTSRRPGAGLVHHRVRRLPVLPRRPLRPVPRRRRLDPRPHDRRHPGRVRPGAVRRHVDLPGPCRRARRGISDAGRHPAHRLRGRRAQRPRPAGRRRRRRRRRADRPLGHHGRPALQPEPHRGHRPGRRPPRGGQAVRRRRHRQQRPRGRRRPRCGS